jgi:trigger factor
MRRQRGALEDVEERRPVADGDVVDVTLTLSDETYGDLVREHQLVSLPDDRAHSFLLDVLRGLEPGERGETEVTVPIGYVEPDWVGRKCRAEVLVHEIKTLTRPALDDEFAKAMGHETVGELRQAVHSGLLDSKARRAREQRVRQLIEAIYQRKPFEVPPTMVADRAQTLVDSVAARLMDGMSGAMEPTVDDLDEEKRGQVLKEAGHSVRRELILEAVARQEGIRLDEGELDAHVEKLAGQAGQPPEVLRQLLLQRGAMAELEGKLLAEKTVDWLLERAELVEEE